MLSEQFLGAKVLNERILQGEVRGLVEEIESKSLQRRPRGQRTVQLPPSCYRAGLNPGDLTRRRVLQKPEFSDIQAPPTICAEQGYILANYVHIATSPLLTCP